MSLVDKLNNDIKDAMRAKDKVRLGVLRMMLSEVKYAQAAVGMGQPFDDAAALKVFGSYQKKLQKSLGDYPEGEKREALEEEIGIVEEYLPKKASAAEVEKIAKEIISASDSKDFGPLMKQVMTRLGAAADGKVVGEILKKLLA